MKLSKLKKQRGYIAIYVVNANDNSKTTNICLRHRNTHMYLTTTDAA